MEMKKKLHLIFENGAKSCFREISENISKLDSYISPIIHLKTLKIRDGIFLIDEY